MSKLWRIHPHDPQRIADLGQSIGVPSVVAQLLLCRGMHEPDRARAFLEPKLSDLRDPALLPGIAQAVPLVAGAVERREPIVVYGDYDVDGMTGTSLLLKCLKLLGAQVTYYVPHRLEEGYGLHADALQNLANQGARLVISVDCGIASPDAVSAANERGLRVIITDHHEPGPVVPAAAAIVHPSLPGQAYPFAGLSGAGVAFKLAWALCREASGTTKVGPRMRDFLLEAVGLAALGTVADVVPLVDENRVLVQHGLASLKERPGPGLAALMRVAELANKSRLDCDDIGFSLAPRLNAAGRLGQAQLAVELLTTESNERATALAEYLHELNASRQSLERSVYLAAHKQAEQQLDSGNDAALVLSERGWHAGVIGIVAGRLAEKYHRPVVLIALDNLGNKPGVGSARGIPGCDLNRALFHCRNRLITHGGHAAAAGLRIEEAMIEAFRLEFCASIGTSRAAGDREPELLIDAETSFAELSLRTLGQIERLAPFGHENPRPLLCSSGVRLAAPARRIGGGGRHLALKLVHHGTPLRAVAFGGGDWVDDLPAAEVPIEVAFRPVINEFQGRRTVEVQLTDWRVAQ